MTGFASQSCKLCHCIIALLTRQNNGMQQMMQATYQVPSRHHPTAAELRQTSRLLSLQTSKTLTDNMITLKRNQTVKFTYSLHDCVCWNPALPEWRYKQCNSYKQRHRYKQCMHQATIWSSQGLQQPCVEATSQSSSSTQHISQASVSAAAKLMLASATCMCAAQRPQRAERKTVRLSHGK